MKAIIIGLGVGVVVGSAIMGSSSQKPVELAPKVEPVEVQPLPPIEVVPLPKAKPKSVEQQPRPKAKPKPKIVVSAQQCAELREGIAWAGEPRVKREAKKRGVPEEQFDQIKQTCGIT